MKENKEIKDRLFELQDLKYRDFHSKLVPNLPKDSFIGVRVPAMRKLAKEIAKTGEAALFMEQLPHTYYDENTLHGLLIGQVAKTPEEALELIDKFLPYVDNWATCDCMPIKILKKNLPLLRETVIPWLDSEQVYRVRFAIVAMLTFLLEEPKDELYEAGGEISGFDSGDLKRLAKIKTEEYYINMAIAWYYSFALIKQYDATIELFESKTLDKWVHNKSIQKAIESYRITDDKKDYLRTLRIK